MKLPIHIDLPTGVCLTVWLFLIAYLAWKVWVL
jgi:hypothetical protein